MKDGKSVILVVDDNPATRYTTGRLLKAGGYDVIEAATGAQALDLVQAAPDAIVLDVNLPDIDGFEVCRQMRLRDEVRRTPIIHLSAAFVGDDYKARGLDSGADGYLTHPVEPPVLLATVNAFLRARIAEEGLRTSERKFRAIFDLAVNGIALLDGDMVYREANPAMCRILGRPREEVVGRPSSLFLAGPKGDNAIRSDLDLFGAWNGATTLTRPDGTTAQLEWHISAHTVPGLRLAMVTDVTERRLAEAERDRILASERSARAEAERANRVKDQFLATVSHELRSPLAAIAGWAYILKARQPVEVEMYRKGIEAIDRNAQLQSQLISDLLDVARISSGKLRLGKSAVDLRHTAREAVESAIISANEKEQQVRVHLPPEPVVVLADATRIHQVLANLLTNAVKFTPTGGTIDVTVERLEDRARLIVQDTGRGFNPQFLPVMFDSFRQEDEKTTRSHQGLGLGLAIVKRIVEMHGGSIEAHSDGEDKGATFTVSLPTAPDQSTSLSAEVRGGIDGESLKGVAVLLVDDDAEARMVVRRWLEDSGAAVTDVDSATAAIRIAGSGHNLLLSDISMPDMDGYELVARLRRAGFSEDLLPAIALTAFGRPEDAARSSAHGFQAHIVKPIDFELLRRTIQRLHWT